MISLSPPTICNSADYRQQGKVEHKLTDIILLTICAVLSGQDDWKAIHLYGTRWLD
ncbi:transposase family protein, partial [Escherichia coli]